MTTDPGRELAAVGGRAVSDSISGSRKSSRTDRRQRRRQLAWYAGVALVALLMLIPVYYMVYLAFSVPGREFVFPPGLIPDPISVDNVARAPEGLATPLWGFARNSVTYAGLATMGALITESMAGFALARLEFPGRRVLFGLTVGMLIMPFVATIIPKFLLFTELGLVDTQWALILPWWFGGSPYGIFLMRQYFLTLPRELDEAAVIDGAGPWKTMWLILMPQAIPVLVALGLLHFTYFWNDLLGPLVFCQTQACKTLPQGILANYQSTWDPQWALFMMSVLLMVLPVAVLFLIAQRRFKQGFLFSGFGGR